MNEIFDKIEKAKQEAIQNPPKKKKGCTSCKKKKDVPVELLEVHQDPIIVLTDETIIQAYNEITRRNGVKEESKVFISEVYKQLFNEEYIFDNCVSCKNTQYHKLRNYILYNLKKRI